MNIQTNLANLARPLAYASAVAALMAATPAAADGLAGAKMLVFNTFQGELTKGMETDVGAFGMNNNLFAQVGDGVELPAFIGLYDIDASADGIAFAWAESDFSAKFAGVTPDGNHDRNYFVFELPAGKAITAISFDAAASALPEGSAVPTAAVVSRNKVVTDFAAGVIRGAGFAPAFKVTIGDAQ